MVKGVAYLFEASFNDIVREHISVVKREKILLVSVMIKTFDQYLYPFKCYIG